MATLSLWRFATSYGADEGDQTLQELDLTVLQTTPLTCADTLKRAKIRQPCRVSGTKYSASARSPSLTPAVECTTIHSQHPGGDEPGTSSLFLRTSSAILDKVREALAGHQAELVQTEPEPGPGVAKDLYRPDGIGRPPGYPTPSSGSFPVGGGPRIVPSAVMRSKRPDPGCDVIPFSDSHAGGRLIAIEVLGNSPDLYDESITSFLA